MAYIHIPRKRKSVEQPRPGFDVDWTNPLTRGLVDVIDLQEFPRSVVLKTPATVVGSVSRYGNPTRFGRAFDVRSASALVYFQRNDGMYATAIQTHLLLGEYAVTSQQYAGYMTTANRDGSQNSFSVQYVDTNTSFTSYDSGAVVPLTENLTGTGIKLREIVARGNGITVYANGKQIGTASGSIPTARGNSRLVLFGERTAAASYAFKGRQLLHIIYNRVLSAAERAMLAENPWQIFKHKRQSVFIDLGGGASQYTLNAQSGIYSFAGSQASLLRNRFLSSNSGNYSLSGVQSTISKKRTLTSSQGSYSLSGNQATLSKRRTFTCQAGSYSTSGAQALLAHTTLTPSYNLIAKAGNYSMNGQAAGLRKSKRLVCESGSYSFSGSDAYLEKRIPGASSIVKYFDVLKGELLVLKQL